ncbi:xanthine dehydrogenase small subunit [Rothia halotolerans]|uniref:xanthine dehydrogenase small subunit n=1 Tax=Rothia halotolerans TaxID=405770 RepID=UPI00101CAB14|nr:FAD binding domain-containing protein [Rothia halotolerans]
MGSFQITVNGQPRVDDDVPVHLNLLDWLRGLGLTGAKEGCAEGECGACAVLVARPDGRGGSRWTSVNACLTPALALDGQELVTSEGLGSAPGPCTTEDLHPVQREMAERGGSQCGFCTPGFVCSMAAEYYRPERAPLPAAEKEAEMGENGFDLHALSGNLCRCTGYRPIKDAAYALGIPEPEDPLLERQALAAPPARRTEVRTTASTFLRPATVEELAERYAEHPDATLLAGATDVGVEVNIRHTRPRLLLAIDHLEELRSLRFAEDHVELGAAMTLSELERSLAGRIPLLAQLFPQFASRLVRNSATLGGNLGTGSPIGDSAPVLLALDASLVLFSASGERTVPLSEYFTGYRRTVRREGEFLRAVRIPLPLAETTAFYKVAKRRFDDISSVSTAFALQLEEGRISSVRIGLGGVAATPLRARAAEEALLDRPWTEETAREASVAMTSESTPMDDHRASARYRSAMLEQSMMRFFAQHRPSEHVGASR